MVFMFNYITKNDATKNIRNVIWVVLMLQTLQQTTNRFGSMILMFLKFNGWKQFLHKKGTGVIAIYIKFHYQPHIYLYF